MQKNTQAKATATPQQWAWQFLRRNPKYREAWARIHALSSEQFGQLGGVWRGDSELDMDVIRSIAMQFFDCRKLPYFKDTDVTFGSYLDRIASLRKVDSVVAPSIAKEFSLHTYCLFGWTDPSISMDDAQEASELWLYRPHVEEGIMYAPFMNSMNDPDDYGADDPGKGFDRRTRKTPMWRTGTLPLIRGIDGNCFIALYPEDPSSNSEISLPKLEFAEVDFRFDLNLPIEVQIVEAKATLARQYEHLVSGGFVQQHPKQLDRNGNYQEYLQILDLMDEGANAMDIAKQLRPLEKKVRWKSDARTKQLQKVESFVDPLNRTANNDELTQDVRKKIERAVRLRDHGYKALAFM